MVIQRKSIFDLERRSSLVEDFNNLCDDFKRKKIQKIKIFLLIIEQEVWIIKLKY